MNAVKCCMVFLASIVAFAVIGCGGGNSTDADTAAVISATTSSSSSATVCYRSSYSLGTANFSPNSSSISFLAGKLGGAGSIDGVGSSARFLAPSAVTADSNGNIYVGDNNTVRKITPSGAVSTLAGVPGIFGNLDGNGAEARFQGPDAIAVDSAGNIYVVDFEAIRKITPDGSVSTLAGVCGSAVESATGALATFEGLTGIAVAGDGTIFVRAYGAIRKISPSGAVSTLATIGSFGQLALGSGGDLFVTDTPNDRIWRVSSSGSISLLAGSGQSGYADGSALTAAFDGPDGIAVDKDGSVFVAEVFNHTIRKIAANGLVTTIAGAGGQAGYMDAVGAAARFSYPTSMAIDSSGSLIVADKNNSLIRKVSASGMATTFAGAPSIFGFADGTGSNALFGQKDTSYSSQFATDSNGNLFVADTSNHIIRKVSPSGDVSTFAGQPGVAGAIDGSGSQARFKRPVGIVANGNGDLYVSDSGNSTIRKIAKDGTVTTLAGSPSVFDTVDGNGAAAGFGSTSYLAIDSTENIYVIDRIGVSRLRKVTPNGDVTTVPLKIRFGYGQLTRYGYINGIAFASDGNLYATAGDYLLRISLSGEVAEISGGNIAYSYNDGNGATVAFNGPQGIAADTSGNLYVADAANHVVRKVALNGDTTTVVGQPRIGGYLPGPTPGVVSIPTSLVIRGSKLFMKVDNAVVVVSPLP